MTKWKAVILAGAIIASMYSSASGAGACCALNKSDTRTPNIAIVGANSWGNLMTDDDMYSLSQQAIILKLSIPIYNGLALQGQIGAPVRTSFGMDNKAGYGGFVFGVGAGYSLPEIANRFSFAIAGSASRSYSLLGSSHDDTTEHSMKSTLVITEGAGFIVADVKIVKRFSIYVGANLSMGVTELKDDSTTKEIGEAMMMASPLVGIRWNVNDRISTSLEAGFGHNNIISLGVSTPLDFNRHKKQP